MRRRGGIGQRGAIALLAVLSCAVAAPTGASATGTPERAGTLLFHAGDVDLTLEVSSGTHAGVLLVARLVGGALVQSPRPHIYRFGESALPSASPASTPDCTQFDCEQLSQFEGGVQFALKTRIAAQGLVVISYRAEHVTIHVVRGRYTRGSPIRFAAPQGEVSVHAPGRALPGDQTAFRQASMAIPGRAIALVEAPCDAGGQGAADVTVDSRVVRHLSCSGATEWVGLVPGCSLALTGLTLGWAVSPWRLAAVSW